MRTITLLFVSFLSINLFGQFNKELPPLLQGKGFDNNKLEKLERLNNQLNIAEGMRYQKKEPVPSLYNYKPRTKLGQPDVSINMNKVKNFYVGAPLKLTESRNPFANDYKFLGFQGINKSLYITTLSTMQSVPTTGRANNISALLNYRVNDRLTISGGPSATKYQVYNIYNYNDVGVSGAVDFKVNDRIKLKGYGNYWRQGTSGGPGSPAFDHGNSRNYGGIMEVKISDKFGMGMGMERELNPFSGKWVNKPIIYPIFY